MACIRWLGYVLEPLASVLHPKDISCKISAYVSVEYEMYLLVGTNEKKS